jgi:hypothetical protein
MIFAELKDLCEEFRILLAKATGRGVVTLVSVDDPGGPHDELHFIKLVSWCYVLLFEAGQPTIRYVVSLLRAADPNEHNAISSIINDVNYLRTVRVHNLLPESRGDDYKRRQASIWLVQNGGDPPDWPRCCDALCSQVASAIHLLIKKWRRLTTNAEDAAAAVRDLLVTIDREWPPHAFDRIVEDAATEIGLHGFDHVKYRQYRLNTWREWVSFFESRERAEVAMKVAIRRELEQLFGANIS